MGRVEARYQGRTKYYPGKILRARISGKYDIAYDDGGREMQVSRDMIRVLNEEQDGHAVRKGDDADKDDERKDSSEANSGLSEGDKVEARCKGSKKHYPGKIFMDNRDGTYDVKFDDGDRDREVPKSSIKKLGGSAAADERPISGSGSRSSGSQDRTKLSAGTRVEARYQGRTKFYPGKIMRARISGKYDISYDDGEREMQVSRDMIRVLDAEGERTSVRHEDSSSIE